MISRFASTDFEYQIEGKKRLMNITVSCGLAECDMLDDQEQLIRRANLAMHEAKNRGKNQLFSGLHAFERSAN